MHGDLLYIVFTCGSVKLCCSKCIRFCTVQMEDETAMSPVLAPKQKDGPKDEPTDNSPSKTTPAGTARGTPSTSKSKSKKKSGSDDAKTISNASAKKVV